jgi:seryl-tRNA synthetase
MLTSKYVLDNFDEVKRKLESRGPWGGLIDEYREAARTEREKLREIEELRARKNRLSDQFIRDRKDGKNTDGLTLESREIGEQIDSLGKEMAGIAERGIELLRSIPNIPHDSVPGGRGSEDNIVERVIGEPPDFPFSPEAHWDIGTRLGILDFERAAKITGSRFAVYFGAGALLERALINFMLDIHTKEKGFKEVIPPFMANAASLTSTGNLPKFAQDLFKLEGYEWYLIPTAEVPLTNIYRNETLEASVLPQRFVAYTPCFRSEAGSYGKDVRGLIRQHQFNKVELMVFSAPENSFSELESMTAAAEEVLKRLRLAYRVVSLCTADLGFASAKTYDLEVWMPSRQNYMEISSCSNCTDFQAGRANIRFRREPRAKPEYVHTLNGSGLAVGRTVSAILENYQQPEGSVRIPEALRPYMSGLDKIALG